jgi:hypothetical protein
MFNFDRFARVATASVGALVLATLSITAAVGPVSAADVGRVATASVHDQAQARG